MNVNAGEIVTLVTESFEEQDATIYHMPNGGFRSSLDDGKYIVSIWTEDTESQTVNFAVLTNDMAQLIHAEGAVTNIAVSAIVAMLKPYLLIER